MWNSVVQRLISAGYNTGSITQRLSLWFSPLCRRMFTLSFCSDIDCAVAALINKTWTCWEHLARRQSNLRTHDQTGLVSGAALITHEGRSLHKSVFLLCHIAFYDKLIVVILSRHILCLVSAFSYNGKNMKSVYCGRKGFLINMELGDELASQMKVLSQTICCFCKNTFTRICPQAFKTML